MWMQVRCNHKYPFRLIFHLSNKKGLFLKEQPFFINAVMMNSNIYNLMQSGRWH